MASLSIVPRTLYDLESDLLALFDSTETVTADQEQQFLEDLAHALSEAKDKRDKVAQYMAHLESQIDLAAVEIERLKERKDSFENHLDRLKNYVVRVMDELGTAKLEGNAVTLALRKCPAAVEILDQTRIPITYQAATLTMPGPLVDKVLDALSVDDPVRIEWTVDKRSIKTAVLEGLEVPGAAIAPEKFSLVRK